MSGPILGIDLGTTNSEVSIVQEGGAKLIPMSNEALMLPSVVGINEQGELLVGQEAKNQFVVYPENTVLNVKRSMGTEETFKLGETTYTPEEISAIILKQLKGSAEAYLKQPVKKAVITVPAYFSDTQRQATKKAGELAGLEVVRIINEPTAAALLYNNDQDNEKRILVYDLGGGTFDVSIVLMRGPVLEVVSSHGNNHLGGNDFDEKIVSYIESHLNEKNIDITGNKKARAKIKRAAEQAKLTLSNHPYVTISEEYLAESESGEPFHLSLELSREDYEKMISSFIDETLEAIHIALQSANLTSGDIDEILLVGGSTKTPLVAKRLESEFTCPLHAEINPDLCVAMGASMQAAIIAGENINTVLVDITPYTFGTSCMGELDGLISSHVYQPIIKKNTPIPVTKSEVFFTIQDNQEAVEIKIFQGENKDASENIELGEFMITGLSKVASGNQIIVSLQLDINGILNVTAKEKKTGLEKSTTINNAFKQTNEAELLEKKNRISHLFDQNIEQPHEHTHFKEAQDVIKKAQNYLDDLNDEDKEDLIDLIANATDAIADNNAAAIEQHIEAINDMLHYCLESV